MATDSDKALLPAGLADDLPPHADNEAAIIDSLMAAFRAYGYERVKPPLIEFEESLLDGPGAALAQQTFRVMDPQSQRMLGVRADMTVQVARIAATRLRDRARPLRLSYSGQVLRTRGSQLRPERQFAQAGFELIGSDRAEADREAILLAAEALQGAGVSGLSFDLTLPHLMLAVTSGLDIAPARLDALRDALDRKDAAALAPFLEGADGALLSGLLEAAGPVDGALAKLEALALPDAAKAVVAAVAALVDMVRPALGDIPITLDPTEYRGFEYHSGISFSVFARGVRGELGRGGRYTLDGGEPATGFSVYLDSLRRAVKADAPARRVFVTEDVDPEQCRRLHAEGWCTVRGFGPVTDAEAEARRLACTHVLRDDGVAALDAPDDKKNRKN